MTESLTLCDTFNHALQRKPRAERRDSNNGDLCGARDTERVARDLGASDRRGLDRGSLAGTAERDRKRGGRRDRGVEGELAEGASGATAGRERRRVDEDKRAAPSSRQRDRDRANVFGADQGSPDAADAGGRSRGVRSGQVSDGGRQLGGVLPAGGRPLGKSAAEKMH